MEIDTDVSARRIVRGVVVGLAVVATFAVAKCYAKERFVLGANVYSLHGSSELDYPYERWTPGLYVRDNTPFFKEVGAFKNSFGNWTMMGGVGYSHKVGAVDLTLAGGFTYGYREWYKWTRSTGEVFYTYGKKEIQPYLAPSVGLAATRDLTVRTYLIPKMGQMETWVVSFALEGRF